MKLIKPSYQILSEIDSEKILNAIEIAGRICYKSEDKITEDSSKEFIGMILKRGHESVIEHQSISVKFVCDRGVSHEIVRHRLCSFSQESTRYCNYSKDKFNNQITFIYPCWFESSYETLVNYTNGYYDNGMPNMDEVIWVNMMLEAEKNYNNLINQINPTTGNIDHRFNKWQPQQARSVLPNSLKTEIVVTANLREWREIFRQRTSKAAHPQMRELMCPLLDELKIKLPVIFDDINY